MASEPQTGGYELPVYPFQPPSELADGKPRHYPVVVVGAGLTGLTAACALAGWGVAVIVLDDDNTVGVRGASSRGIVYAQKSLEIFARLGIYQRIQDKGVTWSVGKTLAGRDEVYSFDASVQSASQQPPFINLQQFYLEGFLVDRIHELGAELRWNNTVNGFSQRADQAVLAVSTPAGSYQLTADWVLDCSGVQGVIRNRLGLPLSAAKAEDRWCISDVRFQHDLPIERWTYIEAPFNDDRAVWQHPMADGVWRLDFQMAPECDLATVGQPEVAAERVRRQLGEAVEFELVWVGPYSYRSHCLDHFRSGRVFFLGDCAHVMSPFGARGGNSGIQDADNLAWKLALVLAGQAPERLLDSYNAERQPAAQHNIRMTNRTTRFLSPPTAREKLFRNAVLSLAREYDFARAWVNTGRLSVPYVYDPSPLTSLGGESVQNAPIRLPDGRYGALADLLRAAPPRFLAIWYGGSYTRAAQAEITSLDQAERARLLMTQCGVAVGLPPIQDHAGKLRQALRAQDGGCYLIRPDGHLAARSEPGAATALQRALQRAVAHTE